MHKSPEVSWLGKLGGPDLGGHLSGHTTELDRWTYAVLTHAGSPFLFRIRSSCFDKYVPIVVGDHSAGREQDAGPCGART